MTQRITIEGPAVCQACQMSGHDGDSCRANMLSNGLTWCVICGSYTSPFEASAAAIYRMPYKVKSLVAALLREKEIHAPKVHLAFAQFGPDQDVARSTFQAAAACAQGNEGVILNGGRFTLTAAKLSSPETSNELPGSRLEFRFQADELEDVPDFGRLDVSVDDLDEQTAHFWRSLKDHSCPPAMHTAIGKLLALGFTKRHLDFSSQFSRRIVLHCGGNIAGTAVPKGIMVEATYLV